MNSDLERILKEKSKNSTIQTTLLIIIYSMLAYVFYNLIVNYLQPLEMEAWIKGCLFISCCFLFYYIVQLLSNKLPHFFGDSTNWLSKVLQTPNLPLVLFFEEAILRKMLKGKEEIRKELEEAYTQKALTQKQHLDAITALQALSQPKTPINPPKESQVIGYFPLKDKKRLLLICLACLATSFIHVSLSILILLGSIVFIFRWLNNLWENFGSATNLRIDLKGVHADYHNQHWTWDEIKEGSVKRILNNGSEYSSDKYELCLLLLNEKEIVRDITAFEGGWRQVYHTIKRYSSIPFDIQVISR